MNIFLLLSWSKCSIDYIYLFFDKYYKKFCEYHHSCSFSFFSFSFKALKQPLALILMHSGFDSVDQRAFSFLTDLFHQYMLGIGEMIRVALDQSSSIVSIMVSRFFFFSIHYLPFKKKKDEYKGMCIKRESNANHKTLIESTINRSNLLFFCLLFRMNS